MNIEPIISVIVPVYNKEKRIENAVDSVVKTNHGNYEVIIVDDGSTDESGKIADNLANKYKKVRVIHQDNQWVYAAFNRGIKEASGKYIYILNADDQLYDGVVDYMSSKVEEYNYPDVVWTFCDEYYGGTDDGDWKNLNEKRQIEGEEYYHDKKTLGENWIKLFSLHIIDNQANLYKRELAYSHPFRNDVYGADGLFNIGIADYIQTSLLINCRVYKFYKYDNPEELNISRGRFYPYIHSMNNEIYEGHIEYLSRSGVNDEKAKSILARWRINSFMDELLSLAKENCPYTVEKKVETIFYEYYDECIVKCAKVLSSEEELEGRIIFALRNIFYHEIPERDTMAYFYYRLIQSIHRFEKTEDDYIFIREAINDKRNIYKIGKRLTKELFE